MSKPFSSMFARRFSKRQVTNRDFNFVRDWNTDSSNDKNTDNHDTLSVKVTPKAQYIISSSKPSPAHGSPHISELSDLISSSPIPVVIQSPPPNAITPEQAFNEEEEDADDVAEEEDEEMPEEDVSGRDGDASMADSTMAVKDDGESGSESFVVDATIQHAQEEPVSSALHFSRKEMTQMTRYITSDHEVSGRMCSDQSETNDSRADDPDQELDGGQQDIYGDSEEEEKEEHVKRRKKSIRSSRHIEEKNNFSSRPVRWSMAKDDNEEGEEGENTRSQRSSRKITSREEEKLKNLSTRNFTRGNDSGDNIDMHEADGVIESSGLPSESVKSKRDIDADDGSDRPSTQSQQNEETQKNKIQSNRSKHHTDSVLHDEERDGDEKLLDKNRQSLNKRESVGNLSRSPKQVKSLNTYRSADTKQQNQNFEGRKPHSGKKDRLTRTRHSSTDVSETYGSDLEEDETSGKRKPYHSESSIPNLPEGVIDEEMDDGDTEDVTQDEMLPDEISQEETPASIMIKSTVIDTPLTSKSPRKRSLINVDVNDEKEDEDMNKDKQSVTRAPPPLKQKKISFSSETKKPKKIKNKGPVHKLGLWQGELDKRYKNSVLDLDIVINALDKKLQAASGDVHLSTLKKKECQLLSHIRKRIPNTIEDVEETRQKRKDILRARKNIKELKTELSEIQQENIRLSQKLGNKKNEKRYRKNMLNDWITSFENLMVASRSIQTKSNLKNMVSFGYVPKIV